jgi:hypothetical protein
MKKILLLLFFMFYGLAQAQDYAYIKSLDSLNNESARAFADQVVVDSKTKYEFLRIDETTKSRENSYEVVYIPIDAINKDKKAKPFVSCDECLRVKFIIYFSGKNEDLEMPGVKTLGFSEVIGSYMDLFPVWKKIFNPKADLEKALDSIRSRELINAKPRLDYRFYKSEPQGHWSIYHYF